ncbi:MAG: histidine phosphatase family protein [Candidatus Lokiarchaeota archaeon]|nr:histidine phosphatase family protein [Candidatus Lokiarchaeota archaeon]
MKKLILIRHGHSLLFEKNLTGGYTDESLSDLGRRQAHLTGKRLAKMVPDPSACGFFCSDLKRASETAKIIGSYINLNPIETSVLRDLNNGVAANKTKDEAKSLELPMNEPLMDWVPYPEAESWRVFYTRVKDFMNFLRLKDFDVVIIVFHFSTNWNIVHWWFDLPENFLTMMGFKQDLCGIHVLSLGTWDIGHKVIIKINSTAHLENFDVRV